MQFSQHLRAILMLPGVVTLIVPTACYFLMSEMAIGGEFAHVPSNLLAYLGWLLVMMGLLLVITTIVQFDRVGDGTLAPWKPPRRLVVKGIYRYMRNPMINGVFCILIGEACLLGSLALLGWFGLFFIFKAIYIPLYEEPELSRRFGAEYRLYKQHVPRWWPRLTPWQPMIT